MQWPIFDFFSMLARREIRVFSLFAVVVLVLTLLGIYEQSPDWFGDLRKKDGASNLIAEGLGILVSLIIIAPLTAHFVEARRQNALAPALTTLINSMGNKIDDVAQTFAFWTQFSGPRNAIAHSGMILALTKHGLTTVERGLAAIKELDELLADLTTLSAKVVPPDERQKQLFDPALSTELVAAASYLASELRHHMTKMWSDINSIERSIEIIMPLLPTECLSPAAAIHSAIQEYNSSLYDLDLTLNGNALETSSAAVQLVELDFQKIIDSYREIEKICKIATPHALKKAHQNAKLYDRARQQQYNEQLYFICEIIARADKTKAG